MTTPTTTTSAMFPRATTGASLPLFRWSAWSGGKHRQRRDVTVRASPACDEREAAAVRPPLVAFPTPPRAGRAGCRSRARPGFPSARRPTGPHQVIRDEKAARFAQYSSDMHNASHWITIRDRGAAPREPAGEIIPVCALVEVVVVVGCCSCGAGPFRPRRGAAADGGLAQK